MSVWNKAHIVFTWLNTMATVNLMDRVGVLYIFKGGVYSIKQLFKCGDYSVHTNVLRRTHTDLPYCPLKKDLRVNSK